MVISISTDNEELCAYRIWAELAEENDSHLVTSKKKWQCYMAKKTDRLSEESLLKDGRKFGFSLILAKRVQSK